VKKSIIALLILVSSILLSPYAAFSANTDIPDVELSGDQDQDSSEKETIEPTDLEMLITDLAEKNGLNGNVFFARSGNILYENSFGYSDFRKNRPLTLESVFQLASVSKQFTSMGIMILHDEGKLRFEDPVCKYIKTFPYKKITIKQLLTHRSGLPDYLKFARKYRNRKLQYLTNNELMGIIARYKPKLRFIPGSRFEYSNTGYAVLSSVIEAVSGKKYCDFMKNRIFTPLGMENTYVFDSQSNRLTQTTASGYTYSCRQVYLDYRDGVTGDKGIFSTVGDMYKWDQALYTDILVSKKTMDEAFNETGSAPKPGSEYGFGWRIINLEDHQKIVYHVGLWGGYQSIFIRRLKDQAVFILLSNRANINSRYFGSMLQMIDNSADGFDSKTSEFTRKYNTLSDIHSDR
jgi:CubicO group peptidase (beta-lactamase class C family)